MIGIVTDPTVGGTFLTWSIHYLRGDTGYFLVEKETEIQLTDNPLTTVNAHGFIPNQPNRGPDQGLKKLYQMCNSLSKIGDDTIVYLHNFEDLQDTIDGVKYLSSATNKLILLTGKKYPLYRCKYRARSGVWISSDNYTHDSDLIYKHLVDRFFKESDQIFKNSKLNAIWDQREFIALNFDPYAQPFIEDHFDHTHNHYVLDIEELYHVENHIIYIFDYLGYSIDARRFDHWRQVYQQWRNFHQTGMMFSTYFDKIINYIINGYTMSLSKFQLDIMQEAVIQRELIYKHNLNLKTWQLEKFTNTKQLHDLLEPNIHPLKTH